MAGPRQIALCEIAVQAKRCQVDRGAIFLLSILCAIHRADAKTKRRRHPAQFALIDEGH